MGIPQRDERLDLASEDALAHRIREERVRRGWSQEKLAKEVEAVLGQGFPQSAVSKIERRQARRAITVDEALAFSKVFGIELPDLLLPAAIVRFDELRRLLVGLEGMRTHLAAVESSYEQALAQLRDRIKDSPEIDADLRAFADSSEDKSGVLRLLLTELLCDDGQKEKGT